MSSASQPNDFSLAGRFIVEIGGQRCVGLAAHEAAALLDEAEAPEAAGAAIYFVHRVDAAGRLELVGVERAELARQEAVVVPHADVAAARALYDAVVEHAGRTRPPCRVELRLARTADGPALVVMTFASLCVDALLAWLRDRAALPTDLRVGGAAFEEFDVFSMQVVAQARIEPAPPREPS